MLTINNINFAYSDELILKNINIHLDDNEFVSILGPSGVGKTTLFNIVAGILPIQSGTISQNNISINPKENISYMLQKDLLLPHKTILDNVALPLIIKKTNKKTARIEAHNLLKEFDLDNVENMYPNELSGGMRQRVALLRTYMFKRKTLLLDEAFSAIDHITRKDIYSWYINTSKKLNLSTLMITHDIDEAIYLSDRIYILKNKPATIIGELKIDFETPKTEEILLTEKFIEYKKEILKLLK